MSLQEAAYAELVVAAQSRGWQRCPICTAEAGQPCHYSTDRPGVVKGAIRPKPHFYREFKLS